MHPMETVATAVEWVAPGLAYNLDFLPEDRLDWKPEPTAKSALAVAAEVLGVIREITKVVKGGSFGMAGEQPEKTKTELQQALRAATAEYAAAVRALTPEELERSIETPWGTSSLAHFATYALIEASHHRGQVLYLQSLLGDAAQHMGG